MVYRVVEVKLLTSVTYIPVRPITESQQISKQGEFHELTNDNKHQLYSLQFMKAQTQEILIACNHFVPTHSTFYFIIQPDFIIQFNNSSFEMAP
jgi:hypothetical protein